MLTTYRCPRCGHQVRATSAATLVFHPCPAKDRKHVDLKEVPA